MVKGINGNYTYTSNNTLGSLFDDPFFIGFNTHLTKSPTQSYPPYNLVKFNDDEYAISIAIAGFSKDDVTITLDKGSLFIKGEAKEDELEGEYVHRGIAARKFTREFALAEFIEVIGAEFKDGILNISLKRNIPEEKKPKTIKIK